MLFSISIGGGLFWVCHYYKRRRKDLNWLHSTDEAHNIKNRKTKAAIACCALRGKYRWALTGTPMWVYSQLSLYSKLIIYRQNNVEELYSLLNFLRIRPLNDWETFNNQINKPVKSGKSVRAMKRLQVLIIFSPWSSDAHIFFLFCFLTGCSESNHA